MKNKDFQGLHGFMSAKKTNLIAFQGAVGAHSDMAARNAYPYMETLPCPSFEDVFEAVEEGRADLGLIPIENSQAGRVAEIHNLLPKTKLHIIGEYFHRVVHVLAAPEGATEKTIKEVYSHPQALMQCRENIHKRKYQAITYSDTALAAKHAAEWKDTSKAALCSELAAGLYGLKILVPHFEDSDTNTTIFMTISREEIDVDPEKNMVLTTLLFTIRNIPAALYKALGGFATNQVNLLKLESYIPGGTSGAAQFYVTLEGHPSQKNVQLALEELGFFTKKVQVLGVYPAAKERR